MLEDALQKNQTIFTKFHGKQRFCSSLGAQRIVPRKKPTFLWLQLQPNRILQRQALGGNTRIMELVNQGRPEATAADKDVKRQSPASLNFCKHYTGASAEAPRAARRGL